MTIRGQMPQSPDFPPIRSQFRKEEAQTYHCQSRESRLV
jgi:hypothetical protein